nr:molybdopterin-dependent oxidoreductase [Solihabitans fulvus]
MSRSVGALVGLLSVAAALAAGHLVAGFVGLSASPYLAVGNTAIDLTPLPLKDFAVRTFGTHDKLVLLSGMALVIAVLALVAGVISRRSPLPGTILAVLLGLVGVAAVFNRPDTGQLGVFAPVVSLAVGVVVFRYLHGLAMRRALDDQSSAEPATGIGDQAPSRRTFLVSSAAVAVGAGVAGLGGQLFGNRVNVEASRNAVGTLVAKTKAPAIPAGADFTKDGTVSFITPGKDFYRVDTALTVPRILAEDWSLRVHGMVDRELNLSYNDLRGRDLVEQTVTMTCVSNEVGGPYISTATFVGVPLRDVLAEAGVKPGTEQLFSTSVDGWTCGSPVDVVMDPARGALLALGMNGEPLPVEHGFPVRIVVPGLYGYVSATKWVTDIELTTYAARQGYWIDRGWGVQGPIKTQSRIDSPQGFARVPAGKVVISGVAWAQPTGIAKVEVRVDGGPWQQALLAADVSNSAWRMWRTEFDLKGGGHNVECRATDKSGYTQTDQRVSVVPDGATGWHSVSFTVQA